MVGILKGSDRWIHREPDNLITLLNDSRKNRHNTGVGYRCGNEDNAIGFQWGISRFESYSA